MGEARLLSGHLEEAKFSPITPKPLRRRTRSGDSQAYALHLLGEIASRREPPERDQAEAAYQQGLTLAEELGMRPLSPLPSWPGPILRQVDQPEQAHVELVIAVTLYRAMEMTFWLPSAEAALAQIVG